MSKKCLSTLFIFLFLIGISSMSPCMAKDPSDILIEIGEKKITRADFNSEIDSFKASANPQALAYFSSDEGQKAFLNQLAEIFVLEKKATQKGLNKNQKYEDAFKEVAVARLAGEFMQSLINSATVSDKEVKELYEKTKQKYILPDEYHVFQISVNTTEKAVTLKKQLDAGKSFIELAKTESIDKFKNAGGDRGFVAKNSLEAEVASAFDSLKKGVVSAPIEIDKDLIFLVKYTDKKDGKVRNFEDVSAQLNREILNNKQKETYESEIKKLKKEMGFELNVKNAELLRKETLTDTEKGMTLFKVNGKNVKVSDVEGELQQIPPFIRSQIFAGEGLNDFMEQIYARNIASAYAEKNYKALSQKYSKVLEDTARRTVVRFLLDETIGLVKIEDSEIEDFYNKNLSQFNKPAQMRASHILVKEETTAKELFATLEKEPAKFAELAKDKSICPSGKQAGGDLGMFGEGQMVPEFDEVCKTAELNKIVGPVKSSFGYHIIRVDERKPAESMKLADVKEDIRGQLLPQKQSEAFMSFVKELKKEFNVKIHQDKL